jgi:predicted PhzF superfamily epimerase YddE/YHI9
LGFGEGLRIVQKRVKLAIGDTGPPLALVPLGNLEELAELLNNLDELAELLKLSPSLFPWRRPSVPNILV